jgi:hypothetical protein
MVDAHTRAARTAVALVILSVATMLSRPGAAASLDAALQSQLLQLYDRHNQAIAAGKADEAVAMRSSETRQEMQPYLASADKRRELLEFVGGSIPDTVEVRHTSLTRDGNAAKILVLAKKQMPADASNGAPSVVSAELTLNFAREDGQWKLGEQTFGLDPSQIVACKNEAFEPIDAYDRGRDISAGGPVARVAFEADFTLLVIRVGNQENCAYLPNRATIQKAGVNPDLLVPYAIAEIRGFPHKTDGQKIWVDHITIREE